MSNGATRYDNAAANFVAALLHSATNAHFMHLQTKSYAQHVALGGYYDEIVDLTDKWAEAYQGKYNIISEYPADFRLAKEPKAYFAQLVQFVDTIRDALPDDKELQNLVDGIADLVVSTLYKIKHLS